MTFLAPLWLALAGLAAGGVVALHLIASRRPPPAVFPTARFVPDGDSRAVTRTARPSDLTLLAMRAGALLLLGAAFARPVLRVGGARMARVIVVDRSRSALADAVDSARAIWRPGDALVLFDSSARGITVGQADSLRQVRQVGARGALSPALVAAIRAASALAPRTDSLQLILVSPVAIDEVDSATSGLFAQWRGRVRLVRTTTAVPVVPEITLESGRADDELRPVVAVLTPAAAGGVRVSVRVIRNPPSAFDSAAAFRGTAIVHWPEAGGAIPHASGVWAMNVTVVAPLSSVPFGATGRVVARWSDGQPAAVETRVGRGCVRTVGIGTPRAGDVALQPAFIALARRLLDPCGNASTSVAASDSGVSGFQRPALSRAPAVRATDLESPVAPWLTAAALLLLVGELFARRARGPAA